MAIKYSLFLLRNPLRPEDPKQYYGKVQVRSVVDMRRIARALARQSSVTEGDAYSILVNLPYILGEFMEQGDMVDLGDLGKFQYQISTRGASERSEFSRANIKKVKFQFRPSRYLLKNTLGMQFEEVAPLKDQLELKKEVKQR